MRLPSALVHSRDALATASVAAANQLTCTLHTFWTCAAANFADIASPISLASLRHYPWPNSPKRLTQAHIQRFSEQQHSSGRGGPTGLLARLRTAASSHMSPRTEQALAKVERAHPRCSRPPWRRSPNSHAISSASCIRCPTACC